MRVRPMLCVKTSNLTFVGKRHLTKGIGTGLIDRRRFPHRGGLPTHESDLQFPAQVFSPARATDPGHAHLGHLGDLSS